MPKRNNHEFWNAYDEARENLGNPSSYNILATPITWPEKLVTVAAFAWIFLTVFGVFHG